MKIFSWSKNIKFNAHPDGSLRYEESKNIAISMNDIKVSFEFLSRLLARVARIYRKIRSRFSS